MFSQERTMMRMIVPAAMALAAAAVLVPITKGWRVCLGRMDVSDWKKVESCSL